MQQIEPSRDVTPPCHPLYAHHGGHGGDMGLGRPQHRVAMVAADQSTPSSHNPCDRKPSYALCRSASLRRRWLGATLLGTRSPAALSFLVCIRNESPTTRRPWVPTLASTSTTPISTSLTRGGAIKLVYWGHRGQNTLILLNF
uniref:Uncharacterized protein n=1 Tax=Oryza brachyantha TaxID=4533 RepID=J3MX65_ORYBR